MKKILILLSTAILSLTMLVGCSCNNCLLVEVLQIEDGSLDFFVNGYNLFGHDLENDEARQFLKGEENITEEGLYHCDENGNITGKCPVWKGQWGDGIYNEALRKHGVDW